ncbi:hypothetical protein [Streptomyces niveus]|uniref:Uncharacterized protein n=1 Tax=Streptomyces niveus TaxID=193462 RepID=A0ABZ2A3Z4_STRNV|nr:hypothetical protein [Streptomyces niveus]
MTAPDRVRAERRRADRIAALCLLLNDRDGLRGGDGQVAETVERARRLLAADDTRPAQLDAAFEAVDQALRRAGDARGLGSRRGDIALPGIRPVINVALCPGAVPCTRREPAKDLRPAPACAVNGVRMRKERLRRDPTA